MSSPKMQHYLDTHKKEITWGDEYIAHKSLWGAWLEIKMVQDDTDPVIYHETWDLNREVAKGIYERFMMDIRAILDILCDEDYGHSTPYVIQIDDKGQCHLLAAKVRDNMETMDRILRNGKLEWVKGDKGVMTNEPE